MNPLHALDPITLAEHGWVPDSLIRRGIRRLLKQRIDQESAKSETESRQQVSALAAKLREGPLAEHTDEANQQHYEVPSEFYEAVLGPRLKYSCCLYGTDDTRLPEAETAMLELTCERAGLQNGQDILELGCGWGSLSLYMAERYPSSRIVAVSNSHSQREFIERRALERKLSNLQVITADVREFSIGSKFDRIVSVEMFEHLRNYEMLFQRVASWLRPEGKLFVHVFCHRTLAYLFETEGRQNWMGRHFFTGGTMPSFDLFRQFDKHLTVQRKWEVNGLHYAHTCDDWLRQLDARRDEMVELFATDLGTPAARVQVQRWRMFFMACAELFRYDDGRQWFVAHYTMHHSPHSTAKEKYPQAEAGLAQ